MCKLTWGERLIAIAILLSVLAAGYLAYASSVDAGNLGPTFTIRSMDKEAKAFVKVAQAGYEEEQGYLKVAGQWYRVSWYFHDSRVKFIRVYSPPIKTSGGSCSATYLKGDMDDED